MNLYRIICTNQLHEFLVKVSLSYLRYLVDRRSIIFFMLFALSGRPAIVYALNETEPNTTCISAQDLSAEVLPLVINGDISPVFESDFFKISGTGGSKVKITQRDIALNKASTTYNLDIFSSCTDATGTVRILPDLGHRSGKFSQMIVTLPSDGQMIISASLVSLGAKQPGSTYQISVTLFQSINEILGRLVDETNNNPLPVSANVDLEHCLNTDCSVFENTSSYYTNPSLGNTFSLTRASTPLFYGQPLEAGDYFLSINNAYGYRSATTPVFNVAPGGTYNLGDINLSPTPVIGSISIKLLDERTNEVITGLPNRTLVQLLRCLSSDCNELMAVQYLDMATNYTGNFVFTTSNATSSLLEPGNYKLVVISQVYQAAESAILSVGANEIITAPDLVLKPLPPVTLRGIVVDAVNGQPLEGGSAILNYCYSDLLGGYFCYTADALLTDVTGRFTIITDALGNSPDGHFDLNVFASQYAAWVGPQALYVAPGDTYDAGTISIQPFDMQFQLFQTCAPLANNGGKCKYTVRIANRTSKRLKGEAWSNLSGPTIPVPGSMTPELPAEVKFQAGRIKVDLGPQGTRDSIKIVDFSTFIPSDIPVMTQLCTDVWYGAGELAPSFNVRGFRDYLFCFQKMDSGEFVFFSDDITQSMTRKDHQKQIQFSVPPSQ